MLWIGQRSYSGAGSRATRQSCRTRKRTGGTAFLAVPNPQKCPLKDADFARVKQTSVSEVSSCCYNDPSLRSGFHKQSFSGCGYCFLPLLRLFRRQVWLKAPSAPCLVHSSRTHHNQVFAADEPLRVLGRIAALHADGQRLGDLVGNG